MQVECTQARHIPDNFRQHSERHYNLQVGLECSKLLQEQRILKFLRLQHGYSLLYRILLYRTALQHTAVTSHGFVRHGNHTYYIIVFLHKSAQRELGKLRGSHEYYPHLFLFHIRNYIKQIGNVSVLTLIPQKVQVRHYGMN